MYSVAAIVEEEIVALRIPVTYVSGKRGYKHIRQRSPQIVDDGPAYLGVEVYAGTGSFEEVLKYLEVAAFDANRTISRHANSTHESVYFIGILFTITQDDY